MKRLLPTETDVTVTRTDEPAVLCLDDEQTRDVFGALSSETAYDIFSLLNERPATPATVADRLDLSIQNVQYHLDTLQETGLITVADTCYSEKGREMEVFVVAEDPVIVFLGTADDQPGLKRAFRSISSLIGPPAVLLAIVETLSRLVGNE